MAYGQRQGGDGRWQPPEWRYGQRKDETRQWYDQGYAQQGTPPYQPQSPYQHQPQPGQPGNGQSFPPPWPSQRQSYAGPVRPPQRGQSWPARHKVLTGALSCAALLIIVIAAVNAGKPPTSPGNGTTAGLTTSPSAAATASAAAARAPSEHVSRPAVTTQTAAAQRTRTVAAASQPPARPAPVPATPAAVAAPPAATAPASCTPLTDGGRCYQPGEFCRDDDHGASGVAGDGEAITCEDNDGWRWEPA